MWEIYIWSSSGKQCKPLKRLHSIVDKHNDLVRNEILDRHLKNKLFQKRYVLETLYSIPYGFTIDMYHAEMNKYWYLIIIEGFIYINYFIVEMSSYKIFWNQNFLLSDVLFWEQMLLWTYIT